MGSRTVIIQSPAHLKTHNNRLVIASEDRIAEIPLTDINCVVLDNPQITLTVPLLEVCSDSGLAILSCNKKHIPSGIFTSFNTHFNSKKRLEQQIGISKISLKAIWKNLVVQKIENQAHCLEFAGNNNTALELLQLSKKVANGDPENIEAVAAQKYFPALFKYGFTRDQDTAINAHLNYGYALIRAALARSISATGLHPALGIHHCNQYNQFNLVDDLIEPYRPLVDLLVFKLVQKPSFSDDLNKAKMLEIFQQRVLVDERKLTLLDAITFLSNSLVECYEHQSSKIRCLPVLINFTI